MFFLHVGDVYSQHAFSKELETDSSWSVNDIYEKDDGYILLAHYYKNSPYKEIGLILFLDQDATVLSSIKDTSFHCVNYNKILEKDNKYYILGSFRNDVFSIYTNAFWVYSKSFEFENFIPIVDTNLFYTDNNIGIPILYENDFIVTNTGSHKQSPTSDTITTDGKLMKIDFEGHTLWEKFYSYNQIPYSEDVCGNLNEYQSGYVFSLTSQYINVPYIYHHIVYTDKFGNEIWRKRIDNYHPIHVPLPSIDSKIDLRKIVKMSNGNLLTISHLEHDKYNLGNIDLLFMELDSLGNEIHSKIIPFYTNIFVQNLHISNQNEFMLTGFWAENDSSLLAQFLMKVDADYNLLWIKQYEVEKNNIFHSTSIKTKDQGYFLAGTRFRYIPIAGYNIILEKTDCEGNIEWDNNSCLIPGNNDMLIFPNPTSTNLIIQCPNLDHNANITLKIYNNLGQVVYETEKQVNSIFSIDVSNFGAGLYYCRVMQNDEVMIGKFVKE